MQGLMTMSHQMKNINTKIEIIKKKKNQMEILEMKSTVTEKKKSLKRSNTGFTLAEEGISKLEDKSIV